MTGVPYPRDMRITTLPAAVLALAGITAAAPAQAAPATAMVNVTAVNAQGQPANGYRVSGSAAQVSDCSNPSPAAVTAGVYSCYPTAASADVCWTATPGSLLCAGDPWARILHRVTYDGTLPAVTPISTPTPFAIELDDGSRCRGYAGGPGGAHVRKDGYELAYSCTGTVNVLRRTSPNRPATINRDQSQWTVLVGATDDPNADYPAPRTRTVTTAWFAAAPGAD